jgi:hypothetical protein
MISQEKLDEWARLYESTCTESPPCAYCEYHANIIRKPQIFTDFEKTELFNGCMKKIAELSRRLEKVD